MPLAEFSWQSLRWLPIAVIAAAIAIGGTWWLYGPQLRVRSRGVRLGLPLLRSMALLALALALLKPVVLRAKSATERGAIVVLIDRSASMGVVDSRSPSRLIALADGLKLLPAAAAPLAPAITQDEVDQLRAQADRISRAASELDYAKLANRGVEAAQARLDDAIAQLSAQAQAILARSKEKSKLSHSAERVKALIASTVKEREAWLRDLHSRVEKVAAAATESENNSADALYRGSADVRAVCDRLASQSRLELAKTAVREAFGKTADAPAVYGFAAGVEPMALNAAAADGTTPPPDRGAPTTAPAARPVDPAIVESDLTGAVRSVLQRYPAGGIRAVVLLSDGRQVGSETSAETLAASAGDVPVYTVPMALPAAPRDVSIVRVTVPPRAFVGETLNVHADVRAVGLRGAVPVQLTVGAVTQSKTLTFTDDATLPAEFPVKLDQPGPLKIAISAAAQPGEISTANNAVERWVNVLSDKVHVVAIAQSAGRDFQFLRDALARTPWVRLDEAIAPAEDSPAQVTAEQLADADLVILEDAGPNLLTADQWRQVRQLVAERGAGAILLAGEAHTSGELLAQPDASQLLPISAEPAAAWRTWAGEWPNFRAVPSRAASDRAHLPEALRLTDDADASLRKWQELPAMYRLMNLSPLKPNASPLLVDAETSVAVVTDSRVGAGRVLFVGMTETWRWRYKIGQRDQDRFWLQMVRQVADEPYAASANGISIDADRVAIEPGQPIRVRVRVRDSAGKPSAEPNVQISVQRVDAGGDGRVFVESLPAIAPGSGRFAKTVNGWAAGEYQVSAAGAGDPRLAIHVAASSEAEMANLAGDERLLRRIAEATGGQSFGPEQLADLPAQLADRAAQHPQTAEVRLWDSPYLFAFVLACLALEWAVRKQAGLA